MNCVRVKYPFYIIPTMHTKHAYVKKSITIKKYQEEWVKENHINLSRFVQSKIDEAMK
jgi:hypothetical protein